MVIFAVLKTVSYRDTTALTQEMHRLILFLLKVNTLSSVIIIMCFCCAAAHPGRTRAPIPIETSNEMFMNWSVSL